MGGKENFFFFLLLLLLPSNETNSCAVQQGPLGDRMGGKGKKKKKKNEREDAAPRKKLVPPPPPFPPTIVGPIGCRSIPLSPPPTTGNFQNTHSREGFSRASKVLFSNTPFHFAFPTTDLRQIFARVQRNVRTIVDGYSLPSPFPALLPVRVCMRGKRCVYVCRAFCQLAAAKRGT